MVLKTVGLVVWRISLPQASEFHVELQIVSSPAVYIHRANLLSRASWYNMRVVAYAVGLLVAPAYSSRCADPSQGKHRSTKATKGMSCRYFIFSQTARGIGKENKSATSRRSPWGLGKKPARIA